MARRHDEDREILLALARAYASTRPGSWLVFRARGLSAEHAEQRAAAVLAEQITEPPSAEDLAGQDVVGSAATGGSSFVAFAGGAALPILPFFVTSGAIAIMIAAVLVGSRCRHWAAAGVLTGGPLLRRGLRQLAIGTGAAVLTYGLGRVSGPPSAEPSLRSSATPLPARPVRQHRCRGTADSALGPLRRKP
jgi:hypothetical protein